MTASPLDQAIEQFNAAWNVVEEKCSRAQYEEVCAHVREVLDTSHPSEWADE
jgi:hypothetical protein